MFIFLKSCTYTPTKKRAKIRIFSHICKFLLIYIVFLLFYLYLACLIHKKSEGVKALASLHNRFVDTAFRQVQLSTTNSTKKFLE